MQIAYLRVCCLNKPEDEQTGAEVPDDELVGVQRIAEIPGFAVYLVGQGDGLVCRQQRQTRPVGDIQ